MKRLFSLFSKDSGAQNYRQVFKDKQFFETIMEHYPFAVLVQNKAGKCVACNKNFVELFDIKSVDITDKSIDSVLPADLCKDLAKIDRELYDTHQSSLPKKISFKTADGKVMVLSVTKVLMQKNKFLLTVFEDITARHEQEEELLHTRTLLQAILDNIPLGVYTRTGAGKMVYANKQSDEILGDEDPAYGDTRHPKQTEDMVENYKSREIQIIADGQTREYPAESYIDSRGQERIIHIIKIPLYQAGPEPLVLTIVDDITKRHQQEKEIKRMNAFLSAVLDNVPVSLYARTAEGKMLFQNKQRDDIFHDTLDELDEYGQGTNETKAQSAKYLEREAELLKTGQRLDIPEENYVTKDNRQLVLHMVKVPVKMPDEKAGFVLTMVEDITLRKQQERNLEEVRLFQQAILDNAPIAIYAYGTENNLLFANKAAKYLFEKEEGTVEEEEFYRLREQKLFETKEIVDIPEEQFVLGTGQKLLFHLIKAPVFTADGKPYMVLTIAEDITLRKEQEKEISKAREFLQKVIDNLPVALSVKKADGKYILWNKRSEELFGVKAPAVIGKENYRTDITREQAEFMLESDRKVFESKRELNIAQELISTPTEGVKIMHTVKTPLYTPTGEADYLLNISEDITAKTKMEKKMREAGEKSTLLVENAREGIVILEDRNIIYANAAVCHLLGLKNPADVLGKKLSDFISADYQLVAQDKYEAIISQLPNAQEPILLRFVQPNMRTREIEVAAISSKYMGRRIVIAFLRDMTEINKKMREIRHDREKFKNVFEYSRTPLFILNHKGYIDQMNKAAQNLFRVTEQDRNFYRNVYIRPALTLSVRRHLEQGLPAQMNYSFDFAHAQKQFPGWVRGEGTLHLHLCFDPYHIRNTEQGTIAADYIVSVYDLSAFNLQEQTTEEEIMPSDLSIAAEPHQEHKEKAPAEQAVEKEVKREPEEEMVEIGKTTTLGSVSKQWMQTLNEVKLPAVMIDLQYMIGYANEGFLSLTGSRKSEITQENFFMKFIRQPEQSSQNFSQSARTASGNAFQVQLDLLDENKQYVPIQWDVLLMKNEAGEVEGYGLIACSKSKK